MPYKIESTVKVFISKEYGARLIFSSGPINPRDQLGKFGIRIWDNISANRHHIIKVAAEVIYSDNAKRVEIFNLDRSSLIKYMQALVPPVKLQKNVTLDSLDDSELIQKFNIILKRGVRNHDGRELRHLGEHSERDINKDPIDSLQGKFYSSLYQSTIKSVARLKTRFLFASSEKQYVNVSEVLAKKQFNDAIDSVPAYQAHVDGAHIVEFHDVPVTSKENYIHINAKKPWRLHKRGKYPDKGKVDTSTGTTGEPTVWVRGDKEVKTVINSLNIAAHIEYPKRKLMYVNAFALGPWATGMTAYETMRGTGMAFASGSDIKKILNQFENEYQYQRYLRREAVSQFIKKHASLDHKNDDLNKLIKGVLNYLLDYRNQSANQALSQFDIDPAFVKYEDEIIKLIKSLNKNRRQIVIAGYPPFLKDLADAAVAQGIDFKKYHARGVVGGQAISEALREKLIESGFSFINSSYGASDLDINIGVETEFEIQLRKAIESNRGLAEDLYGKNKGLPMIFHYDPFNYHIEVTADNELIYTCNRSDRSSPRIRYQLGDQGRVYASSDVQALLIKHGVFNIKPKINLPLLFVWGRDSAVSYRGAKVSFTDFERAITVLDSNNEWVKRAFYKYEENGDEKFEIWIELADGIDLPSPKQAKQILTDLIVNMGKFNQDFDFHLHKNDSVELPKMRLFTKGNSPISDASGHRKQVMVFTDKNLPDGYVFESDKLTSMVISIVKDDLFLAALNNNLQWPVLRKPRYLEEDNAPRERIKM